MQKEVEEGVTVLHEKSYGLYVQVGGGGYGENVCRVTSLAPLFSYFSPLFCPFCHVYPFCRLFPSRKVGDVAERGWRDGHVMDAYGDYGPHTLGRMRGHRSGRMVIGPIDPRFGKTPCAQTILFPPPPTSLHSEISPNHNQLPPPSLTRL